MSVVGSAKADQGKFHFLAGGAADVSPEALGACLRERVASGDLGGEDLEAVNAMLGTLEQAGILPFEWTPQEERYLEKNPRAVWADYLVYRYKFKVYPAQHRVSSFPVYLLIEPTSVCNLRCTVCFQVDKSFTKKPYMGVMPPALFKRLVDEAHEGGTKAVTLASRGEPTLHPELGELLAYASHGKFLDLKLNTNATRMTETLCHQILESDVTELVFSIDSHVKGIYEQIRVRGKYDEVLAGVERFANIRAKHYSQSRLSTRVSGVRFRADQDAKGFNEFWSKLTDHVGYVDVEARWDTYANPLQPELTRPCAYLWERMYVWFDGTCNPCDVDYKSLLAPGSVADKSLREVWHGEAYTKLRRAHLDGRRAEYNPCDRCGV